MFSPVDTKRPLAKQEEDVLSFWKQHNILGKSIEQGITHKPFSFYDGPPFATGLPHYGHLLVGTIKDTILRYKFMQGYQVSRRFGWDCHGLPVENEIEKSKELSGVSAIEAFGIDKFNEECRRIVLRYTGEWENTVERFGRWVDFSDIYKTMDPTFMESVWWVFAELWKKGLVYEGYKVMPFSAKLGTPLSNFEAGENYKEVDDPSIVVALDLEEDPNCSLLVWTTTPWTLISNLAITAHPEVSYVVLEHTTSKKRYILAEPRIENILKDHADFEEVGRMKGKELGGKRYKPLFANFISLKEEGAFRVILDEFVQMDEGTGLVHTAPGFGEVDFYACKREAIPIVCPVDQNGLFTDEVPFFEGRFVKDCDKEIIKELKGQGRVLVHSVVRHRYPFCWRSDTPLIYKAVSTWFVAVEKIKEKLLKSNEEISWVPEHLKYGRFGRWLENARDWAISRNRYWGTPIPLWRSDDGEILVIESRAQLEELSGEKVDDLHRHFIDHITIAKDDKVFHRIPEVFDCWFESGSMPYAQLHYPFQNQDKFSEVFPADFIAEALDQTRGWFYTLTVLSSALFDRPAFKNVIVNGIVLAEDGNKMSKRLKNYPDPLKVVGKHGADAVRLYMLASPAVHGDDMCFSESGVELTLRQILLPLWNAYSFFITYARIYEWEPLQSFEQPVAELDRWMLSITGKLIVEVEDSLDRYDLSTATNCFQPFMDRLTNWYIRRSRRRFWSDEDSQDRREAFETLYRVLVTLSKVIAPFAPFISETLWQNLSLTPNCNLISLMGSAKEIRRECCDEGKVKNLAKEQREVDCFLQPSTTRGLPPESVHLAQYPSKEEFVRDHALERAHEAAQLVVKLAHALRKGLKIKVRQPLAKAFIVTSDLETSGLLKTVESVILDEINVKAIEFSGDEHQFVTFKAKPNFRVLGKKVGSKMRAVQHAIDRLPYSKLQEFMEKEALSLHLEQGGCIELSKEDLEIVRIVRDGVVAMHEGGVTVAFEVSLDEDLIVEGFAREVINKLNTMRREADFSVTDRITVCIKISQKAREWVEAWMPYIQEETLTSSITFGENSGQLWDLNGEMATITIERV